MHYCKVAGAAAPSQQQDRSQQATVTGRQVLPLLLLAFSSTLRPELQGTEDRHQKGSLRTLQQIAFPTAARYTAREGYAGAAALAVVALAVAALAAAAFACVPWDHPGVLR